MNKFFASLAQRVQPTGPPIQPRRPSRFEAVSPERLADEAAQAGPGTEFTPPHPDAATRSRASHPHPALPPEPAPPTDETPRAILRMPGGTSPVAEPASGLAPRPAGHSPRPEEPDLGRRAAAIGPSVQPPSAPATPAALVATATAPAPPAVQPIERVIELRPVSTADPARTEAGPGPARAAETAPPAGPLRAPALVAPPPLAAQDQRVPPPAPAPRIEVTIGTVEVRAIMETPAPPPTQRAARGPTPPISLDEYLRRHASVRS